MSKAKKIKLVGTAAEKVLNDNDIMKMEIASELGLMDKVAKGGWKSLTARESGRIGGIIAKRKREKAALEKNLKDTE